VAKGAPHAENDRVAGPAEVRTAIEAMTVGDFARLRLFGRQKLRALGDRAGGVTEEDLLSEAMKRGLEGRRRWDPSRVDFCGFLIGTMRSMASHLARAEPGSAGIPFLEASLANDDDPSPMDHHARTEVTPERQAAARDQLAALEHYLIDDAEATLVIGAWKDGMTGPEIKETLSWTQADFETVVRRIRRQARSFNQGGSNA